MTAVVVLLAIACGGLGTVVAALWRRLEALERRVDPLEPPTLTWVPVTGAVVPDGALEPVGRHSAGLLSPPGPSWRATRPLTSARGQ